MREIKFRAWDKENNVMFDVFGFDINHVVAWQREGIDAKILNPTPERDNCILMQYTGLLDKNKNEIYEGDIVKTRDVVVDGSQRYYICEITWMQSGWHAMKYKDKMGKEHYLNVNILQTEIIGNIYENPELLEVI